MACPDIDAPYEFSSTDMCARLVVDEPAQPTVETTTTEGSSGSSKKNSSPNAASGGIIAVAVIASALVRLVVERRLGPRPEAHLVEGGGRWWKVVEGGGRWWKVVEGRGVQLDEAAHVDVLAAAVEDARLQPGKVVEGRGRSRRGACA